MSGSLIEVSEMQPKSPPADLIKSIATQTLLTFKPTGVVTGMVLTPQSIITTKVFTVEQNVKTPAAKKIQVTFKSREVGTQLESDFLQLVTNNACCQTDLTFQTKVTTANKMIIMPPPKAKDNYQQKQESPQPKEKKKLQSPINIVMMPPPLISLMPMLAQGKSLLKTSLPNSKDLGGTQLTKIQKTVSIQTQDSIQSNEITQMNVFTVDKNDIFTDSSTGCKALRIVISKSQPRRLQIKYFRSSVGERMIAVTNPYNLGRMDYDIDPIEARVSESGEYSVIIPFRKIQKKFLFETSTSEPKFLEDLDELLDTVAGKDYMYCPGFTSTPEFPINNNYERFETPFTRIQSIYCLVWYRNEKCKKRTGIQCEHCSRLGACLSMYRKRKKEQTAKILSKKTHFDSTYPIRKLTEEDLRKRLDNSNTERRRLAVLVNNLTEKLKHKEALLQTFLKDAEEESSTHSDKFKEATKKAQRNKSPAEPYQTQIMFAPQNETLFSFAQSNPVHMMSVRPNQIHLNSVQSDHYYY